MNLINTFRYHSQILGAKSSALETIHHAGDRGAEREDVLEEFLAPLLPHQLAIGRGEVRATNGQWSKQEDLIIYDRLGCPRLFTGTRSQVFPVESVAAVIEVKSKLNTQSIQQASKNIERARSLQKTGAVAHLSSSALTYGEPTPMFGVLFAYKLDIGLETLKKRWVETQSNIPAEHRINLMCILDEMIMIHVDHTFPLWDRGAHDTEIGNFRAFKSKEDSLFTFTLLLLRVLGDFRFGRPDLFKYYFGPSDGLEFEGAFD